MNFEIRRCGLAEYESILKMQEEVFKEPFTQKCLHRNTPELLKSCLFDPHLTLGAFGTSKIKTIAPSAPKSVESSSFNNPPFNNKSFNKPSFNALLPDHSSSDHSFEENFGDISSRLAAIGVLYVPDAKNHFGPLLDFSEKELPRIANMKLVIVLPEYRGNGLQRALMNAVITFAQKRNFRGLYSTAHPENIYSIHNLIETGFVFQKHITAYEEALSRNLYYREL